MFGGCSSSTRLLSDAEEQLAASETYKEMLNLHG